MKAAPCAKGSPNVAPLAIYRRLPSGRPLAIPVESLSIIGNVFGEKPQTKQHERNDGERQQQDADLGGGHGALSVGDISKQAADSRVRSFVLSFFSVVLVRVEQRWRDLNTDNDGILSKEELLTIPELRVNPFSDRILAIFSSAGDGSFTFEDLLDFMSVFSEDVRPCAHPRKGHSFCPVLGIGPSQGFLCLSDLWYLISISWLDVLMRRMLRHGRRRRAGAIGCSAGRAPTDGRSRL